MVAPRCPTKALQRNCGLSQAAQTKESVLCRYFSQVVRVPQGTPEHHDDVSSLSWCSDGRPPVQTVGIGSTARTAAEASSQSGQVGPGGAARRGWGGGAMASTDHITELMRAEEQAKSIVSQARQGAPRPRPPAPPAPAPAPAGGG